MMNEDLLKVLARLSTQVGERWPIGSWVYVRSWSFHALVDRWYLVKHGDYPRIDDEWSEAEANARGIFRLTEK